MENALNNQKLSIFSEISDFTKDMAILTGSLALIMHNQLIERDAGDLDIILPYYIDLSSFGKIERFNNPYSTVCFGLRYRGCEIHAIIDPECHYTSMSHNERTFKLSNIHDIWIEKFKSFMFFNTQKNCKDLNELIQRNLVTRADNSIDFNDLIKS